MSHEVLESRHVAAAGPVLQHPTIEVMAERLASGSRRGAREDGHVVALAVEGGGIAGIVSAGESVVLEAAGLIDAVDQIYGTSSGALNGLYMAAGRGALGATNYLDIMNPDFAALKHLLKLQPIINLKYLFENVIKDNKPIEIENLIGGPEFIAVGVSIRDNAVEMLSNFETTEDLMSAARASAAMPVLSGRAVKYRGKKLTDGAMLASVPFRLAQENGASHVLALRTRGENYRKKPYHPLEVHATRLFAGTSLAKLLKARPELYNVDADELQYGQSPNVAQIAPGGPEIEPVEQMEKSLDKVQQGFLLGAMATAKAFGMPELEVDWDTFPPALVIA